MPPEEPVSITLTFCPTEIVYNSDRDWDDFTGQRRDVNSPVEIISPSVAIAKTVGPTSGASGLFHPYLQEFAIMRF